MCNIDMAVVVVREEERMDGQREAVTTLLSCGTLRGAHLKRGRESRLPALILGGARANPWK